MDNYRRRFAICAIAALAIAAVGLFSFCAVEANKFAAEKGIFGMVAQGLSEYARKHNGHFPSAPLPNMSNGDIVKGSCVLFANVEWDDGGHPVYLYFPGKTLSPQGNPEIIGASLVVLENYGRPVRMVIFSDGTAKWCDDNAFLQFLRGSGTAVPGVRVIY
jgi:hypothetical protein